MLAQICQSWEAAEHLRERPVAYSPPSPSGSGAGSATSLSPASATSQPCGSRGDSTASQPAKKRVRAPRSQEGDAWALLTRGESGVPSPEEAVHVKRCYLHHEKCAPTLHLCERFLQCYFRAQFRKP